jgi:lambda repressor-like predicted transcriptional regulator
LTPTGNAAFLRGMSNVLADDKHHQIVALGRLGWSLRRIERTTGVRRETISGYLKAGFPVDDRHVVPLVLLLPLWHALYTVRQLDKLEKRDLLSQPAADQLFKAALTQLSVGYVMPVS